MSKLARNTEAEIHLTTKSKYYTSEYITMFTNTVYKLIRAAIPNAEFRDMLTQTAEELPVAPKENEKSK